MLPLADSPRDPSHVPWVTLALIALNIAVAALTLPLAFVPWEPGAPGYHDMIVNLPEGERFGLVSGHRLIVRTFGFRPALPSFFTSLSSMFLHGGLLHLVGNMLYLWIYGPNVERRLGRGAFVLLYLTAGLLGTLLYALLSLGSDIPVIGASGAIAGVLGAYLIFFPLNTIRVLVPWIRTLQLPAWMVLVFFLVVDNLWPYLASQGASMVAHTAHLGGFAGGVMLAVGLRFVDDEPVPGATAKRGKKRTPRSIRQLEAALDLWRQGLLTDAHAALTELLHTTRSARVAEAVRGHLAKLEADPAFLRATRYSRDLPPRR